MAAVEDALRWQTEAPSQPQPSRSKLGTQALYVKFHPPTSNPNLANRLRSSAKSKAPVPLPTRLTQTRWEVVGVGALNLKNESSFSI